MIQFGHYFSIGLKPPILKNHVVGEFVWLMLQGMKSSSQKDMGTMVYFMTVTIGGPF